MPQAMMQADTTEQEAFIFPQGLAGFTSAHRFGFVYGGNGDMICMQSLDQPEAAFILTQWDEKRLGSPPKLTAEQFKCIQGDDQSSSESTEIMWLLVLNPFADKQWVTANLRAPIALNPVLRRGIQCIRHDSKLELRSPWIPQPTNTTNSPPP
ncbi:MAG: flagellar assembly protein FliW [Mariprofundaceae bacterium]